MCLRFEDHCRTYHSFAIRKWWVHGSPRKVDGQCFGVLRLWRQLQALYKPPHPPKFYVSATYTSKVHVYIRTQLQKHSTQYCSWTSRLQSFVIFLHRRRAASLTRGQHSRRLCWSCPQEQQYCRSCTAGNFLSLLVLPTQEWQRDDL